MDSKKKMKNLENNASLGLLTLQYAQTIQRLTGKPRQVLMEQAEQVATLVQEMKTGVIPFIYIGQDGVIHKVKGTLKPYQDCFKSPYFPKPYNRFVLYYNPELQAWRTFQLTGFFLIEDK